MTTRPRTTNGSHGPDHTSVSTPGDFIAIALSASTALELAGTRRISLMVPEDLTAVTLSRMTDVVVACPLLGSTVDALDVIEALAAASYHGAVWVVAPAMPNPRMVERELKRAAKRMSIKLILR